MRNKSKSTNSKKRKPKSKISAPNKSLFQIFEEIFGPIEKTLQTKEFTKFKTGTSVFDETTKKDVLSRDLAILDDLETLTNDFAEHKRKRFAAAYGGKTKTAIHLITCEIAGAQFSGSATIVSGFKIGMQIQMVVERINEFDANAIRLEYNGLKVGYIPKEHNQILRALMQAGLQLYAVVVSKNPDAEHIRSMVEIGVYLRL